MLKRHVSPIVLLGTLLGVLSMSILPAMAQNTDNTLYDDYNNAKVAYVGSGAQLQNTYSAMASGLDIAAIRFVRAGVYHVGGMTRITGGINVKIQGPGSFYMDNTGNTVPPNGPGGQRAANYGVTLVGSSYDRFLTIYSGEYTIEGVTLMNYAIPNGNGFTGDRGSFATSPKSKAGRYPDAWGGTIYNAGTLTLKNVTIVNSYVKAQPSHPKFDDGKPDGDDPGGSALGGAIYNSGTLTMTGCTILNTYAETEAFDDKTSAMGGAIYSTGTLNVSNCTFENNHAKALSQQYSYSGGTFQAGGRLAAGGAIAVDGEITATNLTFTTTSAEAQGTEKEDDGAYGGAVYGASAFPIKNSFFEDSDVSRSKRPDPDPLNPTYKLGQAIGTFGATGTGKDAKVLEFIFGSGGNHNTASYGISSDVTDLQDNGGPTLTRAPSGPNSFLVDTGVGAYSSVGTVDQRGANRIIKGTTPNSSSTTGGKPLVDIGAVEFDPNNLISGGNTAPFIDRNTTIPPATEGQGTIEYSQGNGNALTVKDANDADGAGNPSGSTVVEATIDSPDAIVKLGPDHSGVTIISQTDHHIVMRGTIANINKALDGLTLWITDADQDYPPRFSVTINDLGNTGYGGALSYDDVSTHHYVNPLLNPLAYLTPVNDPPFVLASGQQFVKGNDTQSDNNTLSFSRENGNPIVVGDLDLNAKDNTSLPYNRSQLQMKVDLTVSHGVLVLGDTTGLVVHHDNGFKHFTIEGPWELLNSTLDTLRYRPDDGYLGSDSLTITVDDLGNYGTGGPLTATKVVPITVNKDGGGSAHNGNVGWFISKIDISGMVAKVTYVFVNGSNTPLTNFVAKGSIVGGAYFDTANATFSPSVGKVTKQFASPKLQRELDPTKNGLFLTWTTPSSDASNAVVIRRSRRISLTVSVPYSPQAIGQLVDNPFSVSFDQVNTDTGNAIKPPDTKAAHVANYP